MDNLELNLAITVAETQILLAALGKLPLETSVSVWMKVKNQAEVQIAAANQAVMLNAEATPDE